MNTIRSAMQPSWNMSPSNAPQGGGGKTGKIVFAVVGLAVAGAILLFVVPRLNRLPETSVAPLNALGQIMAEEAAKMVNNSGRILVVAPDPSTYAVAPALKERLTAFEQALKKQGGITLAATETVAPDEAAGIAIITPESFANLVQKYADVDGVVSFIGPPMLAAKDLRSLPKKLPKFLVLSLTDTPLKPLFRAGVIQTAIVNRFETAAAASSAAKSAREMFDQSYQIVTSDNANSLPN